MWHSLKLPDAITISRELEEGKARRYAWHCRCPDAPTPDSFTSQAV